jgi:hypothetical protein
MDLNKIELNGIDKKFEFEKHSRLIDKMDGEELRNFAKMYCKMYILQQEVISSLGMIKA